MSPRGSLGQGGNFQPTAERGWSQVTGLFQDLQSNHSQEACLRGIAGHVAGKGLEHRLQGPQLGWRRVGQLFGYRQAWLLLCALTHGVLAGPRPSGAVIKLIKRMELFVGL